ncbi:MAG: PAS domain-containing sensor histidine kinase [bacterium]|nr:PAS domain-containing sensor histidine kinase [bacterium]
MKDKKHSSFHLSFFQNLKPDFFRKSLDHMIEGCQIITPDWRYVYVNDAAAQQSQYSKEKLIGRTMMEMYPGIEKTEMFSRLKTCFTDGNSDSMENEFTFPNGTKGWYELRMEPVPGGILILSADITQRKLSETRLKNLMEDLKKFQLAVEHASDHVIITDPDGTILFANKAVERVTGYSRTEAIGQKMDSEKLWGGQMPAEFYRDLWNTIKVKKRTFIGKITNQRKNGQTYVAEVHIAPVLDNAGVVVFFVGIERDITKEAEIDKAKTEFVSLASHQLSSPLSTINWYLEMLLDGDAGPISSKQKDFLSEILAGSRRMTNLVNALLNVSRLDLGTFVVNHEPVNLVHIIEDILKECYPEIQSRKLSLKTEFESELPSIMADSNLIRIIFQNLLTNAVKYTPARGRVSIALSRRGASIIGIVSDTGIGIPSYQQDKVFSKLFRGDNVIKRNKQGTGLGLYMVKSILDAVGGKIRFVSQEGKGTTFTLTLPVDGIKMKSGIRELTANLNISDYYE